MADHPNARSVREDAASVRALEVRASSRCGQTGGRNEAHLQASALEGLRQRVELQSSLDFHLGFGLGTAEPKRKVGHV
jgi:hypothetical protein